MKYSCTILCFIFGILVSSCVVNDRILGEDFVPEEYIIKIDTAEFSLEVTSKKVDSIQGFSTSHMLIGSISDDVFGTSKSSSVSYVTPTSSSLDFGDDPEFVDAYVNLIIDSTYSNVVGHDGIAQNIHIYKLNKVIDTTTIFNTSFSMSDVDPEPISIGSPVYFGTDSLKIRLSQKYAEELLSVTSEESEDFDLFTQKIKGIYITCGDDNIYPSGGRLNYIPLSTSRIYVKYKYTNAEENIIKQDSAKSFFLGAVNSVNIYETESGDMLAEDELTENIYLEGLSGVKPFINGEYISKLLNEWVEQSGYPKGSVVISRASISLPYEMPSDFSIVDREYPWAIYPCVKDLLYDELDYFKLPSEIYGSYHTGDINRSHQDYLMDVTSYIQDQIKSYHEDDSYKEKDLWFIPVYKWYDSSVQSYEFEIKTDSGTRATLNGSLADRKPTLKLVYSVLSI